MKIETKYNINQEFCFIEDYKIKKEVIEKLTFIKNIYDEYTLYYFKSHNTLNQERCRNEQQIFATKEELINSL